MFIYQVISVPFIILSTYIFQFDLKMYCFLLFWSLKVTSKLTLWVVEFSNFYIFQIFQFSDFLKPFENVISMYDFHFCLKSWKMLLAASCTAFDYIQWIFVGWKYPVKTIWKYVLPFETVQCSNADFSNEVPMDNTYNMEYSTEWLIGGIWIWKFLFSNCLLKWFEEIFFFFDMSTSFLSLHGEGELGNCDQFQYW